MMVEVEKIDIVLLVILWTGFLTTLLSLHFESGVLINLQCMIKNLATLTISVQTYMLMIA